MSTNPLRKKADRVSLALSALSAGMWHLSENIFLVKVPWAKLPRI
jgi:hypothetical protein